ncbi:chondroitin n-acetylgalactosaminyltransferase domain-containing protein [Ditylenchus destructor]|nr:chondroitin n-acetylgalactosaminyltransferase domain-containing protein [Ditylenchus destructor]
MYKVNLSLKQALDLPLIRQEIRGTPKSLEMIYTKENGDEVEDLRLLMTKIQEKYRDVKGVSVGAINSTYQKERVKNICERFGIVPLCLLWERNRLEMLDEMIGSGINAILIKVAGMGLNSGHLSKNLRELFDQFNSNARQRGRTLQFQNIQYGYSRVEPLRGVDYILDIVLWFKRFRPPNRATISVRRHAYVQQTFGPLEAQSDEEFREQITQHSSQLQAQSLFESKNETSFDARGNIRTDPSQEKIHIIVALLGRAETFKRFAENLRKILPVHESNVELVVVHYRSQNASDDVSIQSTVDELSTTMPVKVVSMGERRFSRGQALAKGSTSIQDSNSLLFFTDVDMLFDYETLERIRLNTILGAQVYFPITFSEYFNEYWNLPGVDESMRTYEDSRGYFRHFGFGLVSIFKSDFDQVGGFNLTINGWGLEDVDLFEKCMKRAVNRIVVKRCLENGNCIDASTILQIVVELKRVAGQEITGSQLIELLENYGKALENGNCIDASTILQKVGRDAQRAVVFYAYNVYTCLVTEVCFNLTLAWLIPKGKYEVKHYSTNSLLSRTLSGLIFFCIFGTVNSADLKFGGDSVALGAVPYNVVLHVFIVGVSFYLLTDVVLPIWLNYIDFKENNSFHFQLCLREFYGFSYIGYSWDVSPKV